ncbi:hypothetical protein B9Z51_12615 [Limnohabitans sp. T6-5]|nr:hypothetical protein B9Z51_12615 [Limnohabitans sp. T6-5]
MNFRTSDSDGVVSKPQWVTAQAGRVGARLVGRVWRFVQTRLRVARICWRFQKQGLSKAWGVNDPTGASGGLGGWWWQAPASQRTTVRKRAGV